MTNSLYISERKTKQTRRTSAVLIGMVTLLLAGTLQGAPGLSISLQHNRVYPQTIESYFMGGTNGTYTINVVNSGPATTGLITVTDTLPNGLTFVSAVGDNWNCSAASGTVTCTTTQSIPNFGTSSSILLTVAVAQLIGPGNPFFPINAFDDAPPATAVINNAATVTAASATIDNATQVDVVRVGFPFHAGLWVQIAANAGLGGTSIFSSDLKGSTGSYSISLLNLNNTPTINPITVTVNVGGMTAVGGNGSNWTCSGLSCTYSAGIAPLASSSVLTLFVAFSSSASGFQARATITDAGGATVGEGTLVDPLAVNLMPLANHLNDTFTTIQATPNPSFAGVPVTITTTTQYVGGFGPATSGTVSFSVNSFSTSVASVPVQPVNVDNNGQASFVTTFPPGEYFITGSFTGDAATNPSVATYVQRIDVPTTGPVISGNVYSFCNTNTQSFHSPTGSAFVSLASPDPLNIFVHDVPGTVQTVQVDLRNATFFTSEAVLIGPTRRNDNFAFFGDPFEIVAGSFSFVDSGVSLLSIPGNSPFPVGTIDPGIYRPLLPPLLSSFPSSPIDYNLTPQIGMDYNGFFPFAGDMPVAFPASRGTDTFTSIFGNLNPNGVWSLAFGQMDTGASAPPPFSPLGSMDAWCLDLTLNLPDVQLSGMNGPQLVAVGSFMTGGSGSYQITAHNNGPGTTSGVAGVPSQITVALDSHLTYVSGSGPNWTCPGSGGPSVTCTYNYPIAAGQDFPTLTINVGVSNSAPATVTSTATFSGGGDGTPSNNLATATTPTTASASAALSVSKVHNGGAFTNLQNGSYSITVQNAGPAATNSTVTVTDVLPPGLSFVSASGTNWNCGNSSGTVTCTNTAAIPANSFSSPITLTVAVNTSTASILNIATINGGGTIVQAASLDTVPITPAPPAPANLSISLVHQPAAPFTSGFISGQNGVYTVTVQNSGGPAIAGVTVTSPISGGFVSVSTGWVCVVDPFTLKLICSSLGGIPAGGSSVFSLTYAINTTTGTSITNTVTVTGGGGTIGTGTASDTATIIQPGLNISKVHNGTVFVNGNTGSYAIKIQNNNLTATTSAIVVQDILPAGLTFITGVGTGWSCQVVSGVVTCTNPQTVPPGGVASTLTLSFAVNSIAPTIQNTATVSGGGVPFGVSLSTDTVTVTQSQPVLTISKVHNGSAFVNGSQGSYTISVQNLGTPTNGLITVTDPLPAALAFSSASGTDWNCTFNAGSNTVTCQTSDVIATNGVSNPITISVIPNTAAASIQNTASVSGGGGVIAIASSTDTAPLSTAVATLTKVHNGLSFINGQNGAYTITVQNLTATPIGAFQIADIFPAGLSFISASGTNWSCGLAGPLGSEIVQCSNATGIPGNGSTSLILTFLVNTTNASIQNTATITAGALPPLTSTDTVTVTGQTGLVISKIHNGTSFINGQNGTYTIAVQNNTLAATTTGILVQDAPPAGLNVIGASGTGWDCTITFATAVCQYGTIPANSSTNPLTITVNVSTNAASISNTATLSGGGTNIGTFSSTDTVNITQPGLAISKVHNGTAFTNGQNGSYSITLLNTQGTSTSTALSISDRLPAGLTFVSASGAGWTCPAPSGGVVTCSYALTIPGNGTSNPLTLITAVNTTSTSLQNQAVLLLPAAGNPASLDTVIIKQPGLAISNVHDGASFNNNQNGSYTISVSNLGPATTGAVTVTDVLPAGLSFVSGSGDSWSCTAPGGSNVTCTRSVPIPSNATTTIALVVAVNTSAPTLSTTANLSGGGGTITVPSSTDTVSIAQPPSALSIAASHNGNFMNGQNGTLTITVSNSGGATVPGNTVSVHDVMPAGFSIVSASGANWSCGGGSGIAVCNSINPLAANSTSTITVTVAVNTTAGSLNHTPTLSGGGGTIVTSTATDTIFITQPASLAISSFNNVFFVNHANGAFTIQVQNSGGPTTAPVTVTGGPFPAGITLVSATGTGWNCSSSTSTSISCQIPSIPGATTANVAVVVAINTSAPIVDIPLTVSGGGGVITVSNNDFVASIGSGAPVAPRILSFNVVWGSQSYNLLTSTRNRLPWLITGIQVQFTNAITNAGLNSITGVTATGISGLGTDTITWTFSPLSIGTFTTAILASGGNALTDVNGSTLAREFDQTFKVLTGDVNDDGVVSSPDVVLVSNAVPAPYSLIYDINGDGVVNTADVTLVRGKLNNKLP